MPGASSNARGSQRFISVVVKNNFGDCSNREIKRKNHFLFHVICFINWVALSAQPASLFHWRAALPASDSCLWAGNGSHPRSSVGLCSRRVLGGMEMLDHPLPHLC